MMHPNVSTDFLVWAAFRESYSFHHQLAAVLQTTDFKVKAFVGEELLL
tara:strand:+ start:2312 stop:2455 length:144 start_codon:yes stop_codon:yes gene_type:complete